MFSSISQLLEIMFDPVLLGIAGGIVLTLEYLKEPLGKIHIDSPPEWRLVSFGLCIIAVIFADNEWMNLQIIGNSKIATIFWLSFLVSILYEITIKGLVRYGKKAFKKGIKTITNTPSKRGK